MNGSGMPVIGAMPMVMPMLMKIWNVSMLTIPAATRLPNVDREIVITFSPRQISSAYSASSQAAPMKPRSSPTTEKMKSVACSGR